jgi:hypothetical protein
MPNDSPELRQLRKMERELRSLASGQEKLTEAVIGLAAQLAVANLPGPGPDGTGKRLVPTLVNVETLYSGVAMARWVGQQRLIGHTDSGALDGADEAWRVGSRELLRVELPEPLELPTGTLVVEHAGHLGGGIIAEAYTVSAGTRVGLDLFDERPRWWLDDDACGWSSGPSPATSCGRAEP